MSDNICTRCGQTGHRASHCPWPVMRITELVTADAMRAWVTKQARNLRGDSGGDA